MNVTSTCTVDELSGRIREIIGEVESTGRPVLVVQQPPLAGIVLVRQQEFDQFREKLRILEHLVSAEDDLANGRVVDHEEVAAESLQWVGLGASR
jgi:PHD/YefM family antitoxin component YafN of YafNO toxin-antitoxin module